MKKIALIMFLSCAAITGAQAQTLTLGIDFSASNDLITHENFAYSAAQYVSVQILPLKNGDTVRIKTFGGRENSVNMLTTEYVISRRRKPAKVAAMVTQYIHALPAQKNVSQSSTNLIAWLEFTSGFNCADNSHILVLTDGLESSDYVDSAALLAEKQSLPKAEVDLTGCALTFYGLGAGKPAPSVKYVRNQWRNWAKQAGASFTAIIP